MIWFDLLLFLHLFCSCITEFVRFGICVRVLRKVELLYISIHMSENLVYAPAKGLKMEVLGNNRIVEYLDLREIKSGGLIITQQVASYFVLFICCCYNG
jgi:hypothetical protein